MHTPSPHEVSEVSSQLTELQMYFFSHVKELCMHPDYEQCKNCEHYIKYETFEQYL
jgi:hypothetical protein